MVVRGNAKEENESVDNSQNVDLKPKIGRHLDGDCAIEGWV